MGQIQSLEELLSMLYRRRLLIAGVLCIGVVLSLMAGLSQPKTYESIAVIQVETPVVADAGAASAGGQSAMQLQAIEQRLTTRESLIALIDRHKLFADVPGLSVDQKVDLMRASISFQSVASVAQQGFGAPASLSALIITARMGNGDQAARVANDLAQSVLDASLAGQSERARETLQFFLEEEKRLGLEIAGLESDLATYKNENATALPGTSDTRGEELIALEGDLRELDQALVAAQGQRAVIANKGTQREVDRRTLEDLDAQIGVLTSQKAALDAQRAGLTASMAKTPEIERELNSYDRRLQQLHGQYDVVTAKLAEAQTNLRLDERQHSEHFSLLERAMVPEFATSGGGKKIAALGGVASLLLALGLAFAVDQINPVLRTSKQMERQLDLRPVIAIPDLNLPGHKPQSRELLFGLPRYAVLGGAVLLLMIAAAAMA